MLEKYNLPPEIEEEIIDILAKDGKHHLRSCALVCRGFLPICRKYIFSSITITTSKSKDGISTIYSFQRLLRKSPEIADYIRQLYFCVTLDVENTSILESLRGITRLETLSVASWQGNHGDLDWSDNPFRSIILHLLHLPTINVLKLHATKNFIVSDLLPCTNLKSLIVGDIKIAASTPFPVYIPKQSIKLDSFSMGEANVGAFLNLFAIRPDGQRVIDFSSMSTLTLSLKEPADAPVAQKLFAHCKMLTDVDIAFNFPNVVLPRLSDLLRPSMHTLKNLTVFFVVYDGDDDPLFGLASELEEMRTENIIEILTINIMVCDRDHNSGDDWARLDHVLSRPGWTSLKRVSLNIDDSSGNAEMQVALRNLPETQFRGLSSSNDVVFDFHIF